LEGFSLPCSEDSFLTLSMVQMQGLTLQQLQDLYYASSDEVRKWMLENIDLAFEK